MSLEDLSKVCEGGIERALEIVKVKEDVHEYLFFKRSQEMGIVYGKRDLTFTKFLLYSFIKEKIGG